MCIAVIIIHIWLPSLEVQGTTEDMKDNFSVYFLQSHPFSVWQSVGVPYILGIASPTPPPASYVILQSANFMLEYSNQTLDFVLSCKLQFSCHFCSKATPKAIMWGWDIALVVVVHRLPEYCPNYCLISWI